MKIKHFAGYGSVEGKKLSRSITTNYLDEKVVILKVAVVGNHEWGNVCDDAYRLYSWLVKRFDKSVKDFYSINLEYTYKDTYIVKDGLDVEMCTYTFKYKQ